MVATVGAGSNTFLVDCEGSGNFTNIQDAIDASAEGNLILVLNHWSSVKDRFK
jgi:hypothetical protein